MEDLRVKIIDKAQEYKVISRSSGPLLKGINPHSPDMKKITEISKNPQFIEAQQKSSKLLKELFELLDELEVKEGTVLE